MAKTKPKKTTKKSTKKSPKQQKLPLVEDVANDSVSGGRYTILWRNKWLTAEARTVQDMVESLRSAANILEEMAKDGVVLVDDGSAVDDYATLSTTNSSIAAKYGMELETIDNCDDDDDECCCDKNCSCNSSDDDDDLN